MRLLLDTHIVAWWALGDPKLSEQGRALIDDDRSYVAVSVASIWEAASKGRLDRVSAIGLSAIAMADFVLESGADLIDVSLGQTLKVEQLPLLHGDPFDRLLVATALADTYRLVTSDRALAAYGDHVLLV